MSFNTKDEQLEKAKNHIKIKCYISNEYVLRDTIVSYMVYIYLRLVKFTHYLSECFPLKIIFVIRPQFLKNLIRENLGVKSLNDTKYLIWLDMLGFEKLAYEISKGGNKRIEDIIKKFESLENQISILSDKYGDNDNWFIIKESFNDIRKLLYQY